MKKEMTASRLTCLAICPSLLIGSKLETVKQGGPEMAALVEKLTGDLASYLPDVGAKPTETTVSGTKGIQWKGTEKVLWPNANDWRVVLYRFCDNAYAIGLAGETTCIVGVPTKATAGFKQWLKESEGDIIKRAEKAASDNKEAAKAKDNKP